MWEAQDGNHIDSTGWGRESLEPETLGGPAKAVAQKEPATFPAPKENICTC